MLAVLTLAVAVLLAGSNAGADVVDNVDPGKVYEVVLLDGTTLKGTLKIAPNPRLVIVTDESGHETPVWRGAIRQLKTAGRVVAVPQPSREPATQVREPTPREREPEPSGTTERRTEPVPQSPRTTRAGPPGTRTPAREPAQRPVSPEHQPSASQLIIGEVAAGIGAGALGALGGALLALPVVASGEGSEGTLVFAAGILLAGYNLGTAFGVCAAGTDSLDAGLFLAATIGSVAGMFLGFAIIEEHPAMYIPMPAVGSTIAFNIARSGRTAQAGRPALEVMNGTATVRMPQARVEVRGSSRPDEVQRVCLVTALTYHF